MKCPNTLLPRAPLAAAIYLVWAAWAFGASLPQWARVDVSGSVSDFPLPAYAYVQDASGQAYAWVKATEEALANLDIAYQIVAEANAEDSLVLAQSRRRVDFNQIPPSVRILHNDGNNLLLAATQPGDRATLLQLGFELRALPTTPMTVSSPLTRELRLQMAPVVSNEMVSALMSNVQQTDLDGMVRELTGAEPTHVGGSFSNIATRNTYQSNSLNHALDYAKDRLQSSGLSVSVQEWSAYDPWEGRTVSSRNLVAERIGATAPSEIVLLCGHIDDMPDGPLAPGADDNASGAVGVLAAARAMQNVLFDRTLRYVLFTGEEQGVFGSEAYAAAAQAANENIVGVFNLDMIAFDSNGDGKLNLHVRTTNSPGYAADFALASVFTNVVRLYGLHNQITPGIYADSQSYSDHESFWNHNVPALLAIEDWYDDVTPYYHTTNDVIETLNFPYYTAFVKAAIGAIAHLANPIAPIWMPGTSTNVTLSGTESHTLYFTAAQNVYYGVRVSNATSNIQFSLSPLTNSSSPLVFTNSLGWVCPTSGAFRLDVSSAADTAATLRLYTLTNTVARVSNLVESLMASNHLVGMGFSLVDGNHVVWQTGFGHADLERNIPADEDTVFMIGSCSKTFGALAAMQLAEEGLLDLDAPFTNALPSFSIQQRFTNSTITPRSILTHHSGLPGDVFNRGFSFIPSLDAPDFVQALLADETTLMPTNTFWAYNNSGLVLLGQAFRHLTGQPLDVFARERLFDRMGMTNSSIVKDLPHIQENLARPYVDGEVFPDEYINLFFAGAIYSTPSDMSRYLRMLLNGGMGDHARVVSNATLAAMAQKQNADIPLDQFNSALNMGIGFVLDPPTLAYMGKTLWHDGGTVYFRSLFRAALDAQLGAFISCNSAEGSSANYEIVDRALQWAYEEKTGIAPPPPVDPGSPAIVHAPPDVVALATNGPFVAGNGFYRFEALGDGLLAHANAHTEAPASTPLAYRETGWFTPTNAIAPQFLFTQSVGRVLCVYKSFTDGVTNTAILGEQLPGIIGFDPAWSNRLGRWWATNMHPDDISWLSNETRLTVPSIELSAKDDILLLDCEVVYAMAATNDALAFAAGLGRNKGSALRARPDGSLAFLGVHYRPENTIPVLSPGTATNGIAYGDEIQWFRIPSTLGQPLTLDLDTSSDITAYLFSSEDASTLGQANRDHAFHLDVTNAQPLLAAVVRNGTNPGPWRLAVHTNAIPFYAQLAPADWPSQLVESAHRYPNADFGHVFVPENRETNTAHVVKIAVARMMSTNAAARPLLFLNGGPGDSGIRCSYQYFLQGFSDTHHVYLIDPRGVNLSQPSLAFAADESPADLQYRLRMLQQADLSAIHTVELAHDVADVAVAFGIAEADLIGQSYGTLLAQTLMRLDPPWLRSVVLDGVVAPNIPGLSQTGPIRHNALEAFFADVATNSLYPAFADALYGLAEFLQDNPAPVPIYGEPNLLNGVDFLDAVLNQLTSTDLGTRERIPSIVWRASRGETAALAELFVFRKDTNVVFNSIHDPAQQMLVIQHDMLPFDSLAAATNACAGLHPLLAELSIGFMEEAVEAAALFEDLGQADPSFTNSLVSPIPTLVVNGTYDTQTGTNWAAEVASHLPNAHLIFLPAVGHGVLFATNGCALQIMRDFFANPAQPPATACAQFLTPDFPSPWPTNAPAFPYDTPATNVFPSAGSAAWYRFTAASGIVYTLRIDAATLNVIGTNAQTLFQSPASGNWLSEDNGEVYLWLVSDSAATNVLSMEVPFILSDVVAHGTQLTLTWQGPTGTTYTIEAAPYLDTNNAFSPLIENLAASNLLQNQTVPLGPDPSRFFRVIEQPSPTNRLGSVILLSDIHLSPFTEQSISSDLLARPVAEWDALFALSTNGLFTRDATGWKTTSPLLLQTALLNAQSACPHPDAVIIPGDFLYYDLIAEFNALVPLSTLEQAKTVLLKTVQYAHMKVREIFPESPIFFALGNNDTFLSDYDIAESGDEFYASTAATFHSGALTNLIAYSDFAATYTNSGSYATSFGNGRVIALQTLYFSANYPRGTSSGWAQLERLEIELQAAAAANRPAWIVLHIPPGIDPYATWQQWKTGNVSSVITDWNELFLEPFCQIVAAHSNHIAGVFAGHYHNRGWQLITDPATTNAVAALHGANGLLYNHGNNPGFTVLTYDRSTLALLAENTYSLDVATHTGTLDPTVPWSIRYSQNQGYGISDLSPASLEGAWTAMADFHSAPAQHFNLEFSGGRTPATLTASNWPVYLNAIRYTLPRSFPALP